MGTGERLRKSTKPFEGEPLKKRKATGKKVASPKKPKKTATKKPVKGAKPSSSSTSPAKESKCKKKKAAEPAAKPTASVTSALDEPEKEEEEEKEESWESSDDDELPNHPSVPSKIHLVLNGKSHASVDSRNLNLTVPYEMFIERLVSFLKQPPFKLKEETIGSDPVINWIWFTTKKYQQKQWPSLQSLCRDDHYDSLRREVAETAKTNKDLANQVLVIQIKIQPNGTADEIGEKQTSTSKQLLLARSREPSAYQEIYSTLLKHLACDKHNQDEWCWKPLGPPEHGKVCIRVDSTLLTVWAQAILHKNATYDMPPEIQEFWNLRKNKQRKRPDPVGGQEYPPPSGYPHPPPQGYPPPPPGLYYPSQQPIYYRYPAETPQRPRTSKEPVDPSPVRGFRPDQYNTDGLWAYLDYLHNEFGEAEYLDAYPILNDEKLGIDIFKRAAVSEDRAEKLIKQLKNDHQIKAGIAQRLVDTFQAWQKSIASA